MKQTIEIEVPDGKKAIWKDDKVVFEDIILQLPRTWEEFCEQNEVKKTEYYLDDYSSIEETVTCKRNKISDKNLLPNRQAAEQHLALMQLHQLRDCYRQGWVPDLADGSTKYCIERYYNSDTRSIKHKVVSLSRTSTFLSFPTNKLAEEFLTNFHDIVYHFLIHSFYPFGILHSAPTH